MSKNSGIESEFFQIPLMHAFRDAHEAGEAKVRVPRGTSGNGRGSLRQRGVDSRTLQENFKRDLIGLLNTTDLQSADDLSGLPFVSSSIINFGIYDFVHLTTEQNDIGQIAEHLRKSLLRHDPRIIEGSLKVDRVTDFNLLERQQALVFNIDAEISSTPVDLHVEFAAEIDVGSGSIKFLSSPRN